jgi:hypothetical protein
MYWNVSTTSTTYTGILNNTPTLLGNVTGLVAGDNWSCSAQAISTTNTSVWNTSANVTILGLPDTNVSIWNGTGWAPFNATNKISFRCNGDLTPPFYCQPRNQDNESAQPIFLVVNNGTAASTAQSFKINVTLTNMNMIGGTSVSASSAVVLIANTYVSYSTSSLAVGASRTLYFWLNVTGTPETQPAYWIFFNNT